MIVGGHGSAAGRVTGPLLITSGASAVLLGFRLVRALAEIAAQAEARASSPPPPEADSRYGPRAARWRRSVGQRKACAARPIDPWVQAEFVLPDLDDGELDDADDL